MWPAGHVVSPVPSPAAIRIGESGNQLRCFYSDLKAGQWQIHYVTYIFFSAGRIFGCYEALDGGELSEALEDFTGGIAEPIDLQEENYIGLEDKRDELFKQMKKEFANNAVMAAAIPVSQIHVLM